MSRAAVAVLVLALGLPVIAFMAAAAAAGVSSSLIGSGLTFFVVLGAVVAMVFEIKRLADGDAGTPEGHA